MANLSTYQSLCGQDTNLDESQMVRFGDENGGVTVTLTRQSSFGVSAKKTGTQGQETLTGIMDMVTKTSLGMGKNAIGMVISQKRRHG